jgi:hypothetical protein
LQALVSGIIVGNKDFETIEASITTVTILIKIFMSLVCDPLTESIEWGLPLSIRISD